MEEEQDPRVKKALIDNIKIQIEDNDPPEARATYKRMIKEGYSVDDTYSYMSIALSTEMVLMVRDHQDFNMLRYVSLLNKLPHI